MLRRHRGGVDVQLYSFLTSTLDGVGVQPYAPAALPLGKGPLSMIR